MSPPTQSIYNKSVSTQNLTRFDEAEMKMDTHETHSIHVIPHQEQKEKSFSKQMLGKGLMSMPNINLKVSMEISDHHFEESSSHYSELDKII